MCSIALENNQEPESVTPTLNIGISRQISYANINGNSYDDVEVYIKSFYDFWTGTTPIVKIKVTSIETGEILYKKRFSNTYLYIFRDGQIQIGRKNLDKIIISKPSFSNRWNMRINEGGIVY